ncbi:MAG TPA: ATP-binding protein, partial [bacterium]|nr:ATP-binding protein [bacterium]
QLRQIVMNLITNASEALGDRPGIISLRTGTQDWVPVGADEFQLGQDIPEGRYAFLEVSDSGCGMDTEMIHRIFDPFFTTKFAGRGLGLASVLGIVRSHGGALRLTTQPGRGSTFRVLLPCSKEVSISTKDKRRDIGNWKGNGTVLVIDDEEIVRLLAEQALGRSGFRSLLAGDGAEGVQMFLDQGDEIVAVVLDLTMPGISGKETAQRILQIDKNARIILSSGYTEHEVLNELKGLPIASFIQKPYRSDELVLTLKSVLEQETSWTGENA